MQSAPTNNSFGVWLLTLGLLLSVLLSYFAVHNYRAALPLAEETLRGSAYALSATVEALALQNQSLDLLRGVQSPDIAFFAVVTPDGILRYHTNAELIGTAAHDAQYRIVLASNRSQETRLKLGTGEEVFEFTTPLHLPAQTLALRLVLHTYRADAVVRRAKVETVLLFAMLAVGWVLGAILYRFAQRSELHRQEMAKQEHLAQLGTMGAVLAHEVRNPLAGVKGYAQLLVEQLADNQNKKYADLIVGESIRLEGLVSDLLLYAKQEPPELTMVDLTEVVAHAADLVQQQAVASRVRLERHGYGDCRALVDRDRLCQVLLNLLQNAILAMPDGGVLTTSVSRHIQTLTLSINDTGHGIALEDIDRVFDPFFTRRARGSGIGLAVCKKYVEAMGGRIAVTSRPGTGSSFRITLPSIR